MQADKGLARRMFATMPLLLEQLASLALLFVGDREFEFIAAIGRANCSTTCFNR